MVPRRLLVQLWETSQDGVELVREIILHYPTAQTGPDCFVTETQYLTVRMIP